MPNSNTLADSKAAFARTMLGLMDDHPIGVRVPSIDLFKEASFRLAESEYVKWFSEHPKRRMSVTAALRQAMPDYGNLVREKAGSRRSSRIYYIRTQ